MLYLAPPFYIVNRVTVFRDHEDPLQWYYLPGPPRLTEVQDEAAGVPVPRVQLIEFRGADGGGGFLNFDVNLGIDPDVLEDIRDEIKRSERLRDAPRLAPAPITGGSVSLMLLDRQTEGAQPSESGAPGGRFVLNMQHNAQPALYGDHQAAFSVQLSQDGVVTLKKALQGEMSPIGVIYQLEYQALRPAYSVRLNIDWDRVQTHLEETFGTDSIFYQSEISEAVDKLIDERAIVLEDDLFVPEGEDEGVMARHDQALAEVKDMITNAFFEPSLSPQPPEEDTWDKIEHLARTTSALAVTGGWGALVGFSYRNIDYTRIDRKKLNFTIAERTAVTKTIYPQGHLSGLFRVLREPGVDLERFVVSVDLDDPWFEKRRVRVISRADFQADGIASIRVTLAYGEQIRSVLLDENTPEADVNWNSMLADGVMKREVTVRYALQFRQAEGLERPEKLESADIVVVGDYVEVNPRELYAIEPIPIQALHFPWEKYPHVEVKMSYADVANGLKQQTSFVLSEEKTEARWPLFMLDRERTAYTYQLVYRAADHRDIEHPPVQSDEPRLTIRDPFPMKRTLEIVPVFNWTQIDRVFVDVTYEDAANDVYEDRSFEFSEMDAGTKPFAVDLQDPLRRMVGYNVTIIHKDGSLEELPTSYTLERRVTVRSGMKGHRVVMLRTAPGDFAVLKLRAIVVTAVYEDDENGLRFQDEWTLSSAADQVYFEYDYAREDAVSFRYQIERMYTNGLSNTTDWMDSYALEVVVPLK